MAEKTYLQAASVRTILGEIIDGHMVFKRDGTVYDFSPDCDKMTFNERQCCNELLRRFTALEAERDALKARLAEAERVMREALKYIKPVIDGNGPARTLILHYLKHANPRPPKEATMATNDGSAPAYRVTTRIGMSREICKMCYHVNRIGFTVPDDVWSAVVPPIHSSDIVCLDCFTRLADEKLIPWDREIQLWPVSLATHLDAVKCAALARNPDEEGE